MIIELTDSLAEMTAQRIVNDHKDAVQEARRAKWYAFVKLNDPHEDSFREFMQDIFHRQEREVISNMHHSPKSYEGVLSVIKGDPDNQINDWLFGQEAWNKQLKTESRVLYDGILIKNGRETLRDMGMYFDFSIETPELLRAIEDKKIKFAREVNQTTIDKLRGTLKDGLGAGESIPDLKDRVRDVFETASRSRAQLIARTETTGAANMATREAYRQSEVVTEKEWLATLDARVRDAHVAMDGEVVGIDEEFSNGLQYPGDPSGEPAQICNCRCSLLPIMGEPKPEQPEKIEWIPAETIGEAENFATNNLISEGGYVNYGKLPLDSINSLNGNLNELVKKYGIKPNYLGSSQAVSRYLSSWHNIKLPSIRERVYARATYIYHPKTGITDTLLALNEKQFGNLKLLEKSLAKDFKDRWRLTKEIKDVISHEYGHILKFKNKIPAVQYNSLLSYHKNLIREKRVKEVLGGYVQGDHFDEFWAETFSLYQRKKLPKDLMNIVKEALK